MVRMKYCIWSSLPAYSGKPVRAAAEHLGRAVSRTDQTSGGFTQDSGVNRRSMINADNEKDSIGSAPVEG